MTLRIVFRGGRVEAIRGQPAGDLLRALKELAAEHPESGGTATLVGAPNEGPRVDFVGTFSPELEQGVRNLWGLKMRGQSVPTRLGPILAFRIAIDHGRVRSTKGAPPEVVSRFCDAFARANPRAVAEVSAFLERGAAPLEITGDMPEPIQKRLQKHWRDCQAREPRRLSKKSRCEP